MKRSKTPHQRKRQRRRRTQIYEAFAGVGVVRDLTWQEWMASKDMSRICKALPFGQAPVIGTGSSDLVYIYIYGLRHVLTRLYASVYLSTFHNSREFVKYRCRLHMDNYYRVLHIVVRGFRSCRRGGGGGSSFNPESRHDRSHAIPIPNLLNHILH